MRPSKPVLLIPDVYLGSRILIFFSDLGSNIVVSLYASVENVNIVQGDGLLSRETGG
jgi:hypothetical protein